MTTKKPKLIIEMQGNNASIVAQVMTTSLDQHTQKTKIKVKHTTKKDKEVITITGTKEDVEGIKEVVDKKLKGFVGKIAKRRFKMNVRIEE